MKPCDYLNDSKIKRSVHIPLKYFIPSFIKYRKTGIVQRCKLIATWIQFKLNMKCMFCYWHISDGPFRKVFMVVGCGFDIVCNYASFRFYIKFIFYQPMHARIIIIHKIVFSLRLTHIYHTNLWIVIWKSRQKGKICYSHRI